MSLGTLSSNRRVSKRELKGVRD